MRYQRAADIVELAMRLQAHSAGLTIEDIARDFAVSRRTAERMRDAVEATFGPLLEVDTADSRRHWRLDSTPLRQLISVSADELAEVEFATERLDERGLGLQAGTLRGLAHKLRAKRRPRVPDTFDAEVEALMQAEGLAMRPGPKVRVEDGLFALVRDAIRTRQVLEFDYRSRSTGRRSQQRVEPYGVLHGNRPFLVASNGWPDGRRLWRLANMSAARATGETFERDPEFDLRRYAERSFGTFQEPPVDVVLSFDPSVAEDAAAFLFHPSQTTMENADGSLSVSFRAGGLEEMCWHLFTWGESVTVVAPRRLRELLAKRCASAHAHHGKRVVDAMSGEGSA